MILATAVIFIFGLDFGRTWPSFLIIAGVFVVLQSFR